jgi:tetratricopeptide (TPR) repeat protein
MFRLVLAIAVFFIMLTSCGSNKPQAEHQPQPPAASAKDTVYSTVTDTLKITDSIFTKEAISFKNLQKSIDSLIAGRKAESAIELLKIQVQYHNSLDQLGFRTLQLANLLYQTGHSAEALAVLESFAVYKPAINSWIDSANALHDKIMVMNKSGKNQIESPKLEVINSLTAQIRSLKITKADPILIIELADSLRSIAPGDSVLAWLEKQVPSQYERADSFCEEQRKVASEKFAASRKNRAKANALLTEAIEALDKCLAKTPSAGMKSKVTQNREILVKELK